MKHLLFVDDEPKVLQGLQRQLRVMRHEWEMSFVESGPQALEFMQTAAVDVVVSDMVMPVMDGAELLGQVMKRHPQTVRLVLSGHADRESVLRLAGPAHQYLSKPCNAEELRCAIARALAMRDLLANENLKRLASQVRSLPTLPTLHSQLTEELRKEEPSVERVGEIISRDIAMTSKILQLVNSAFFGLPQQVGNVTEAVVHLGLATIRSLVLSVQVFSQFDSRTCQCFSIEDLARHCWRTAVAARRIAQSVRADVKVDDQCFLAGLLHDVGYLVLATGLPQDYGRIVKLAREQERPVWECERQEFGATHAELGAYLLGLWGFATPVIEAVALHHRPSAAAGHGFSPVLAVHVADALVHGQDKAIPETAGLELDLELLATLGLQDRLEQWKAKCLPAEPAFY